VSAPVSPWATEAELQSPDGRFRAVIEGAVEVGMGAPTSGTLKIDERPVLENCNPSMVWSIDSKLLAVPVWAAGGGQRLALVDPVQGHATVLPERFSVLELHSFEGGLVRGVDSPAYAPRTVEIDVRAGD